MTQVQPRPVDTSEDDDDLNHVGCDTRNRTWCGQSAEQLIPMTEPLPPMETFCRVCLLAVEMHKPGDPCPVCGTVACLS